jgi:hypothetical protein
MERRLEADPASLDAENLEAWNREFLEASASAERGPEWPAILDRAQALSARIQTVLQTLLLKREELKSELESQTAGKRALRAYNPQG